MTPSQAYIDGFMHAAASLGVDADALAKSAGAVTGVVAGSGSSVRPMAGRVRQLIERVLSRGSDVVSAEGFIDKVRGLMQ